MTLYQNGERVTLPIGTTIKFGNNMCTAINNACVVYLHDLAISMNNVIEIHFGDYLYPSPGEYTVNFDFIVSPNGMNLGFVAGTKTEQLTIINDKKIAFKASLDPTESNVIKKDSFATLDYSLMTKNVDNPNILVSLEKKEETNYIEVDLNTYVVNNLNLYTTNKYELGNTESFILNLKNNLPVGTYRLKFDLLNNSVIKSTTYEYIVVK